MVKPVDPAEETFGPRYLSDLGRLTMEAITGLTDLVEAVHHTITSLSAVRGASQQHQTKGVTGMVYRNIRATTELVGKGLDPLLDAVSALLDEQTTSPSHEALLAALNGVLGDHLVARNNGLAIPMQFRRDGKAMDQSSLCQAVQQSKGRLVILVHGLCMNDSQWHRQGHDHGAAIARDLDFSQIYLHYNTGCHISENGTRFSDLLETTVRGIEAQCTLPIELFIVAHSMGGLVSRSACHYGKVAGHDWPKRLRKLIFLGTPHQGSLLEKGGNLVDVILELNPYSAPFSRLGKIRSRGITDLRYGHVVDEDWQGRDRFECSGNHRTSVPLPQGVDCYTIAGTSRAESSALGDYLIGDGLVTLDSALGRHPDPRLNLAFPSEHQWVGRNLNHMDLLNHPKAYATILKWLKD